MDMNASHSSDNASHSAYQMDPQWIGILEAAILFCIMLLAIVGNVLVIAVVHRQRELRRTETHIFIVNLSITDISVALLCMPFSIITAVTQDWIFSNALCHLNGFLNVFFLLTSILTLTAISIHKYVGVVQPTKRKIFTKKKTVIAVLWVWFQAFLTALTPIIGWNTFEYIPGRTQCSVKVPRDNEVSELTNCLFIIGCGFVIPLAIMSFSYLKIFQTVKIHTKRVRTHSFGEEQSPFLNERRITVTLFIILAVFLACWSPFCVLTIYATVAGNELPRHFSVAAYWLGFLNSAMNPVIYALRTKEFRHGYRQIFEIILSCCFRRVDSRDSDSIAVFRGRRSLKSDVQMTLKRRTQSHASATGHSVRKDSRNASKRKDTFSGRREKSESAMCDATSEFSMRHKESLCRESNGKDRGYAVIGAVTLDVELNSVETHKNGTIFHGDKRIEKATIGDEEERRNSPSNCNISQGYLSPIRRTFLTYSKGFSSEGALPANNFENNTRARRKSTSFVKSYLQEVGSKNGLQRSKSDCSCTSQGFEREGAISCPIVDTRKANI